MRQTARIFSGPQFELSVFRPWPIAYCEMIVLTA